MGRLFDQVPEDLQPSMLAVLHAMVKPKKTKRR
jgi:hypothetical protein